MAEIKDNSNKVPDPFADASPTIKDITKAMHDVDTQSFGPDGYNGYVGFLYYLDYVGLLNHLQKR